MSAIHPLRSLLCGLLAAAALLPGVAAAEPWGMKQIPRPPGLPQPPNPWDRDQDRGRDGDWGRQRQWQEQQQREARERNERESRWRREDRGDDRWDRRWDDRRWDDRRDRWGGPPIVRPLPPRPIVVRPRYGTVVPVLPWAATVLVVGTTTYWYCDGIYYRRLPADAGYQVVDEPLGQGRVVDERLYVYPRAGQSAEQQASDEYECHRWAVEQTGFDPTAESAWTTDGLQRRDDYRRAQSACLDGRGYTVR